MKYLALRCRCGSGTFRVTGRPRAGVGLGSHFWRTLTRVWREARQPLHEGAPIESPFRLPLRLKCEVCGAEGLILDGMSGRNRSGASASRASATSVDGAAATADPAEPWEAYRCRVCRRGEVAVVVGLTGFARPERVEGETCADRSRVEGAAEVVCSCRSCRRQERLAWLDDRPTLQEVQLDRLYGRR